MPFREFRNESDREAFIDKKDIDIISVETLTEKYDTGFPLPYGTFITDRTLWRIWYKEKIIFSIANLDTTIK